MELNNLFLKNTYSAEAKKLIAYSLLQNRSLVVSKKIKITSSIKNSLFYDIVRLGWGKERSEERRVGKECRSWSGPHR